MHKTRAFELLMFRGKNGLAPTADTSVPKSILMIRTVQLAVNRCCDNERAPILTVYGKPMAAMDTLPTCERSNARVFVAFALSPLAITGNTVGVID